MPNQLTDSEVESIVASAMGGQRTDTTEGRSDEEQAVEDRPTETVTEESAAAPEVETQGPETREELEGRLRYADYTRKTTALAEERKRLAAEQNLIAQERERMMRQQEELSRVSAAIQGLDPDTQQRVYDSYQAISGRQEPRPAGIDPRQIERLVNERVAEAMRPHKEDAFVNRMEVEVRNVASQFGLTPDQVMTEIAPLMKSGRIDYDTPMDLVTDLMAGRVALSRYRTAKAEGEKEIVEQINTKSRAPSVRPESRAPKPVEPDTRKMGENEFKDFLRQKMREGVRE